ncbi:HAD-IA family hydrolase [Actinokineospora cianjurensis]|uniref:HAD-IA family hydrolase n=1 Tax=Actinokineospora cianjurensis TaxID=585224 RepID=UPI001FEBBBBB|nr:HAD-IA family hydrolase [Actinokineospora cianjurensis]
MTDAQRRAGVANDLVGVCGCADRAAELVAAWTLIEGEVDQAVREILVGLRGKVPVGLVSNATTRLEDDLRALGVADVVDFVVSSARVGVAKPDAGIYLAAAREAGVPPQECLFIDDTEENVVGARAVGMTGVHYRRIADLTGVCLL